MLLRVAHELLKEFSVDKMEMCKLCLKCYYSATFLHIPPSLQATANLSSWMLLASQVVP